MSRRLTRVSRMLRRNATPAERILWQRLRNRQLASYRFRRQQPIGRYIVDLVCLDRKLIVELDGSQHGIDQRRDAVRDEWFVSQGFCVLHFWNHEVLENIDGVIETIYRTLSEEADATQS